DDALTLRRVHERGGFRAAILEYMRKTTFRPLVAWLAATYGAVTEGCLQPRAGAPGYVVIAVPEKRGDVATVVRAAIARFPGVAREGETPTKAPEKTRPPDATDRLHEAIAKGDLRAVKAAIAEGAKVERRHGPTEDTALVAAVKKKNAAAVRALLAAGAKPN